MSDEEIGPSDKSVDASMKRYKARQKHKDSTGGRVTAAASLAQRENLKDEKLAAAKAQKAPDEIEVKRVLGIPVTTIERWRKKGGK